MFRIAKDYKEIQKNYLDFLRGLFKGSDYIELAYMTGILPIKKYGEHKVNSAKGRREGPLEGSAINIFDEYSMIDPKNLGQYFGFTVDEVQSLSRQYDVNYAEIEKWYDGYLIGSHHIYNPKSVADVMMWKEFQSYWTGTETYETLFLNAVDEPGCFLSVGLRFRYPFFLSIPHGTNLGSRYIVRW